jgi:ribosomal protein S18 acetylase RimI-like enzyme
MSALLPAELPAGFTVEPATRAHAPEVFEVSAAEQTAVFGLCPDTEEDVRAILEPPPTAASIQFLVRDPSQEPVQWWSVLRDPGDPIPHAWVASHPRLPDPVSDHLARVGWAMMLDWISAHPPDIPGDTIEVHAGCPAGSERSYRQLAEAGFAQERTFWEMLGPVTDASRSAAHVPGLVIAATEDVATLHQVLNEAFAGHYGFTPTSLENWSAVEKTLAGFDPNLRYLATIDGEPAAAMLLSRRAQSDGAMYVAYLATLEPFRRRGIASALLAYAFEVAAHEGLGQLSLHVDSENSHAAPAVYRRAGLEVRTAFSVFGRTLARLQSRTSK